MQGSRNFLTAGILLVAYIGMLLGAIYYAQLELRRSAAHEIQLAIEKRAAGLSYFISERRDDLKTLQAHPAVQTFFVNNALGMSMKYGLRASLIKIDSLFSEFLTEKTIGDGPVFNRLLMVSEGRTLTDSWSGSGHLPVPPEAWEQTSGSGLFFVESDGKHCAVLREAVYYEGRQVGAILAWLNLGQAFRVLAAGEEPNANRKIYLANGTTVVASSQPGPSRDVSARFAAAALNDAPAATSLVYDSLSRALTVRVPVAETPLSLTGEYFMDGFLGHVLSNGFILSLLALAILVIAAVAFLFTAAANHMVLSARVNEATEQQRLLNEQNKKLAREIRKRKEYEERLVKQANYDALTGLPNRNLAMDRLAQAINLAERDRGAFAVMFLDLDRFKNVNDTLGHDAGDELLRLAAHRLQAVVRVTDTIARLGGDEFLILQQGIASGRQAMLVAEQILTRFSAPFDLNGHKVAVTASIGIAVYPNDGKSVQNLLKNADMALYAIKDSGKNSFRFFSEDLNELAKQRLVIESELLGGLDRNEFSLVFQPMVDLRSGECIGSEALLRWNNRNLGAVSPARFIPIAEDTGLIETLGEWVLRTACREAVGWQNWRSCMLAVNVSSRQFRNPARFARMVKSVLDESGLPPGFLELELTESLLIEQSAEIKRALGDLSRLGVRLAIDDFGTGYSALGYLKKFPFDKLKIDQSFVRDVLSDPEDAELVAAIVAMAKALHLDVLGEGIEYQAQAEFLLAQGCGLGQGYLFSRPLTSEQLVALISAQRREPSYLLEGQGA